MYLLFCFFIVKLYWFLCIFCDDSFIKVLVWDYNDLDFNLYVIC